MSKIAKFLVIFIILMNISNKFVNCLNASEIDSYVLLHNSVKNTLIEIAINGRCDSPKPTVVYVNETKDKLYLPRATILYRCSDQFACCPNPRQSCMASEEEEVDIGFYTLTKTEDQLTERSIEVLKFQNHTKCNCRRIDSKIIKESKDILLTSHSTNQEFQINSTINVTTPRQKVTQNETKSTTTPIFIEKHLKKENKTKNLTETQNKPQNTSQIITKPNIFSTSLKPLNTDLKLLTNSATTVPFIGTTKPTFLIIKNFSKTTSSTLTTKSKTTEPKLKTNTNKPLLTTNKTTKSVTKQTTKPIVSTVKPSFNTKTKEKERNFNSITTPDQITHKTQAITTTPLSTTPFRSKGTLVPLIRSSINYDELEREEDLKPEEDVIYNNGNGFDLFYTNGIFFRPLTTTPYRSHRSIERVTPKCG